MYIYIYICAMSATETEKNELKIIWKNRKFFREENFHWTRVVVRRHRFIFRFWHRMALECMNEIDAAMIDEDSPTRTECSVGKWRQINSSKFTRIQKMKRKEWPNRFGPYNSNLLRFFFHLIFSVCSLPLCSRINYRILAFAEWSIVHSQKKVKWKRKGIENSLHCSARRRRGMDEMEERHTMAKWMFLVSFCAFGVYLFIKF